MEPISVALIQLQFPGPATDQFIDRLAATGHLFKYDDHEVVVALSPDLDQLWVLTSWAALGDYLLSSKMVRIIGQNGDSLGINPVNCSLLGKIVGYNNSRLPRMSQLLRSPAYRLTSSGALEDRAAGYDPISGTVVVPSSDPLDVVGEEVDPTYPHLNTIFSGLLFTDTVYKANLIGLLCAMAARSAIREFPLILIDSRQKSSGKTAVASAMRHVIMGGAEEGSITYSGTEQEFEVRLGAFAGKPGPIVIHVDNVRAKQGGISRIRSQVLAASVHSHVVRCRQLYKGPTPLADPVVLITMNGARVEGDLADKSVVIALVRPPGPDNHRALTPHPLDYAREHRLGILAEIRSILSKVNLNEKANYSTRFYQFEGVVLQAAKLVGLEASFDPARVRSTDVCLDELLHLIQDEKLMEADSTVSIQKVCNTIQASPGIRELNEVLSSSSRAVSGRVQVLTDYLQDNVDGHTFRWCGKVVRLDLQEGHLVITPITEK